MNAGRTIRNSSLAAAAIWVLFASFPGFAGSPDGYLKGTFVAINYDDLYGTNNNAGEADYLTVTFDGAGNYSGTGINNADGVLATQPSNASTYSVSASGAISFMGGDGAAYTGQLSGDGNTMLLTPLVTGHQAQILVAVRTGAIVNVNTASGLSALLSDTTGANNTAFGAYSLYSNTTGKGNAGQGVNALYNNTSGIRNLGIGSNALYSNVTGSYNLGLGFDAGYNATGNDNIYLNNLGIAGESQTMRLGAQGTAGSVGSGILSSYIAGVATSQVTGAAVYIDSSGKLGVLASSERFKTHVTPMGDASDRLAQLRPVTYQLKSDSAGTVQYGLIAEEVARIYPELVIRGADGRIDGVRYEELAPLLLNEVTHQQAEMRDMQLKIERLQASMEKFLAREAAEAVAGRAEE